MRRVLIWIPTVDATKSAEQKKLLEIELEAVGIRLNTKPPDVVFKQKSAGGVSERDFGGE
jgi:ribosome-interacting GTPase 1